MSQEEKTDKVIIIKTLDLGFLIIDDDKQYALNEGNSLEQFISNLVFSCHFGGRNQNMKSNSEIKIKVSIEKK